MHQNELLSALRARRVDMSRLERELEIVCAAQIAYADMVLNAARDLLGRNKVKRVVHEHRAFLGELQAVAERLTQAPPAPPSMALVRGGRARTQARTGHLTVVKTTTSEL